MKEFFRFVDQAGKGLFLLGVAVFFLWHEGYVAFPRGMVIFALQLILVSGPAINITTSIRWLRKWPTPVSWFAIAFALTALAGFCFSAWALLGIYEVELPLVIMKIFLPALVSLLSVLAMLVAFKWYKDRSPQKSAK